MAYRNKTYVAFDGDNDIHYYRLMTAWKSNENLDFNFHDAHDLNTARDSSLTDSIKAQLRERMSNAKQMVLLVGDNTKYLRNFVPWEIKLARAKDIPIIVANLNKDREYDEELCPSAINDGVYTMNVAFGPKIIQYALDNFPSAYEKYRDGKDHTYYYKDSVYDSLGV